MRFLSTLLLASANIASTYAQEYINGDVWIQFQFNPTTDWVTIETMMPNNYWFGLSFGSAEHANKTDMIGFFARGRNSYMQDFTSNDYFIPTQDYSN